MNNYWLDLIAQEEKEREEKELMETCVQLSNDMDNVFPDKHWPGETYMGDAETYCQNLLFRNAAIILAEFNKQKRIQAVQNKKMVHVKTLEAING